MLLSTLVVWNFNFIFTDAGILFSNSVIQNMVKNIDWCVKNVFSSSDDDNFGRCAIKSSNIACQESVQVNSLKINTKKLDFTFYCRNLYYFYLRGLTLRSICFRVRNSALFFYKMMNNSTLLLSSRKNWKIR